MSVPESEQRARIRSPMSINASFGYGPNVMGTPGASTSQVTLDGRSQHLRQDTTRQGALPTAADFFVPSLPGIPNLASHPTQPLNLYAGHLPSYPGEGKGGGEGPTGKDAYIFFMMAKARRSAGKGRVIFWFNGGPGCSSFDGSLMEVGPFRTVPASQTESGQVEVKLVQGGWEEFATVIFVDQPPGTGYSFIPTNGYLHELDQGSQHLIQFLQNFYVVFPELKGVDTYFAGESFAGQYIPYFTSAILNTTLLPDFNLQGIAIGNGWIDPKQQYPGYRDFAIERGLIVEGTPEAAAIDAELARCQKEMDKYTDPFNTPTNINHCGGVMDAVSRPYVQELNGQKTCMNVYDVRLTDEWPACGMNWPPDLPDVYEFLRRTDVISALHANRKETAWVECDSKVGAELHMRSSPASVAFLPDILQRGVQVLMFAGAEDLICNYKGIERMIEHLDWSGEIGFGGNTTADDWFLNDEKVGTWQTSRNLSYAKVLASSHMVGFDVPHVTNDMILRFMDVDFSLVPGQAASSKSRIGDDERVYVGVGAGAAAGLPLLKGGKSNIDAWYNIVSALVILFILGGIVAFYLYRKRFASLSRRKVGVVNLPRDGDEAERVPLGSERVELQTLAAEQGRRKGKGKGRAVEEDDYEEEVNKGTTVFELGDED